MSHLKYVSAEDVEYDNNQRNFFKQLMRDCLVSYTQNGENATSMLSVQSIFLWFVESMHSGGQI